jgi:hypothetical protein
MSFSFGSPALSPVYVVARDYNEAASKAFAFAEYKRTIAPKKSVLTPDGSLVNRNDEDNEDIKIRSISVVSDDVIW